MVRKKQSWIDRHLDRFQKQKRQEAMQGESLSESRIKELIRKAGTYIPERVRYFSELMGVDYAKVTIRKQKTRWGSCSGKGNLSFNCLLMLMPQKVIDYVVVHELCHRKEMNHFRLFWQEVQKVMPDYRVHVAWLKEHGGRIINR